MIVYQGKEYYPLDFDDIILDGKTYYGRSESQRSWFYLDLRTGERTAEEE